MNTILCDIEAVINSRPLSYLAEDPTQLQPLTPMMFLRETLRSNVSDLDKIDVNLNKRMRYCQSLRNELRKRFRSEYLGQLARRVTKGRNVPVKIGDIVLVGQDNRKRLDWPLAQIIKVFPGKDGIVRVAKVKTATGELVRPIQRLYPILEMSDTSGSNIDNSKIKENQKEATPQPTSNIVHIRSGRCIKMPDRFGY